MISREDMEAVIESILFVAHDPVSRARLVESFGENEREQAGEALEAVIERYREQPDRGVIIDEVAGGLRFVTRPTLDSYLKRFFEVSSKNKLTMPALESLAIIAYRQPITGPEVAELRNVGSTGVVKKLLERRLIRIAGRKEVVGKPFLYATTREFLMHFGLRSLKELPPLEQFEELFGDEMAPPEDQPPDSEEIVDREAAELAEAADDAADRQERDEIEEERAAAEEGDEISEDSEEEEAPPEVEEEEEEAPPEVEEEEAPSEAEEEETPPEVEEEEAAPEAEEEEAPSEAEDVEVPLEDEKIPSEEDVP